MTTIADIRAQYPQYQDLSDEELAKGLHQKYYSDLSYEDFSSRIGLSAQPEPAPPQGLNERAASAIRGVADRVNLKDSAAPMHRAQAGMVDFVVDAGLGFAADAIEDPVGTFVVEPAKAIAGIPGNTYNAAKSAMSGTRNTIGGVAEGDPEMIEQAGRDFEQAGSRGLAAAGGAIQGAGLIPALKGVGQVKLPGRSATNTITPKPAPRVEGRVDDILVKAVQERHSVDANTAKQMISAAQGREGELAFQALDLTDLARGVDGANDAAAATLRSAVIDQQRGQQARISQSVKRIIGADDFTSLSNDIAEKLRTEGVEAYQRAFQQSYAPSEQVQELMTRPSFKAAMKRAQRLGADKGLSPENTDLEYFQLVKESLDDMIASNHRQGRSKRAGALIDMKNDLLADMDAQVPEYAAARSIWAGEKANEAALDYGRNALKKRAEDVARDTASYSKSERQHLLAGVLQGVDDLLRRSSLNDNATNRFKAEELRGVFRTILPERQADRIVELLDQESRLTATGRAVRGDIGSQTSPRQEAIKNVNRLAAGPVRNTAGAVIEASASPVESTKTFLRTLSGAAVRKAPPEVLEALAIRLAGTPDEFATAYRQLSPAAQKQVGFWFKRGGGIGDLIVSEPARSHITATGAASFAQPQPAG